MKYFKKPSQVLNPLLGLFLVSSAGLSPLAFSQTSPLSNPVTHSPPTGIGTQAPAQLGTNPSSSATTTAPPAPVVTSPTVTSPQFTAPDINQPTGASNSIIGGTPSASSTFNGGPSTNTFAEPTTPLSAPGGTGGSVPGCVGTTCVLTTPQQAGTEGTNPSDMGTNPAGTTIPGTTTPGTVTPGTLPENTLNSGGP